MALCLCAETTPGLGMDFKAAQSRTTALQNWTLTMAFHLVYVRKQSQAFSLASTPTRT
jgi:hypothetical protein